MTPMAAPNYAQPNYAQQQQQSQPQTQHQHQQKSYNSYNYGYYYDEKMNSTGGRGTPSPIGPPKGPPMSHQQHFSGGRNFASAPAQFPSRGNSGANGYDYDAFNGGNAFVASSPVQPHTSQPHPHPLQSLPQSQFSQPQFDSSSSSSPDLYSQSMPREHRLAPKNIRRPPPALSQLSPLPSPSRWDALPYTSNSPTSPRFAPHAAASRSRPTTPLDSYQPGPLRSLTAKTSFPDIRGQAQDSGLVSTVESFNFSRPRKPSIRQPIIDTPNRAARPALLPTPVEDSPEMFNHTPGLFQRPRRPSLSSNISSSTWAPGMNSPTTGDFPEFRSPASRVRTNVGPPPARPYFNYNNRTDSSGSAPVMGGAAPWVSGDELRSSFRSQLTASSAPGTANTERSSVLTKDSSATSLDANPDHDEEEEEEEPSLEDVMGMYEKGFGDDEEDHSYEPYNHGYAEDEDFLPRTITDTERYRDPVTNTDDHLSDPVTTTNLDGDFTQSAIIDLGLYTEPHAVSPVDGPLPKLPEPPVAELYIEPSRNSHDGNFMSRSVTESTFYQEPVIANVDELPEPSPILGQFSEPASYINDHLLEPSSPSASRYPEPVITTVDSVDFLHRERYPDVVTSPVDSRLPEASFPEVSKYPKPAAASIHNVDEDDFAPHTVTGPDHPVSPPTSNGEDEDDQFPEQSSPANSRLEREIRQSKMIFTSAAFMASVPHLASAMKADKETEKRDSGKSIDSDPSVVSQPTITYNQADSPHNSTFSSTRSPTVVSTRQNTPSPAPSSPARSKPEDSLPPRDPSYPESCLPPDMPGPVEPEDPGLRDRYGFKKETQHISRTQYDKWNTGYSDYLARRKKKWQAYLKENSLMTDEPNRFPTPSVKTKKFVRKGIPPEWRGAAWFYYAGGPAILAKHSGLYGKLLDKHAKRIDVEAIERDLHRTFPDNINFKPPPVPVAEGEEPPKFQEPPIIASLRRVLFAFSIYNPHIGYCQSLNFIAGMLLLFVDTEEQCFWLLNVITHIYLPGTHEISLEGSKVDLGVLMTEIRDTMPAVWDKIGGELEADPNSRPSTGRSIRRAKTRFRRKDATSLSTERLPPITLCMTAWFMSCFIGTLPIETTLRVWDVFFYEGSKTLFRTALAIFKTGESEVLAVSDPMEMFGVVQAMPRRMLDANALMEACFRRRNGFSHISQGIIEERRQERREKVKSDDAARSNTMPVPSNDVDRKPTLFGRRKRHSSRSRLGD